jgi:hypothetical protein
MKEIQRGDGITDWRLNEPLRWSRRTECNKPDCVFTSTPTVLVSMGGWLNRQKEFTNLSRSSYFSTATLNSPVDYSGQPSLHCFQYSELRQLAVT